MEGNHRALHGPSASSAPPPPPKISTHTHTQSLSLPLPLHMYEVTLLGCCHSTSRLNQQSQVRATVVAFGGTHRLGR